MSNEAQGLVRNLPLDAPHKPVLMAYANYADEAGYCWPGVDTIAFDTGYSVPTVVRVRRDLVKANWVRSKRQFGSSATTRLNLPKIAAGGVDRGDRTKIRPEFEFEGESAGHSPSDHTDLKGESAGHSPSDHTDLKGESAGHSPSDHTDLKDQISVISTRDHTDHLSIREPSGDPSLDARSDGAKDSALPTDDVHDWALAMVANLDFGRFRRPTRKRANSMALKIQRANQLGLTEVEIKRHCRAALNEATTNGSAYLDGALDDERLPLPDASPLKRGPGARVEQASPTEGEPMTREQATAEFREHMQRKQSAAESKCNAWDQQPSPTSGRDRTPQSLGSLDELLGQFANADSTD